MVFYRLLAEKSLENENKTTKYTEIIQNLIKTLMNLRKNLHLINFRLFHGLKSIQNYSKKIKLQGKYK